MQLLLASPAGYQIKEDEMDWGVRRMRENRNVCRFLVGNTEGKRPLGRRRRRRENNTKLDLTGTRDEPRTAVSTPTKIGAGRGEIGFQFSLPQIFQTAPSSTQQPGQQPFPGGRTAKEQCWPLSQSSAEVKNAWCCTSSLPYVFMVWFLIAKSCLFT